MRLRMGGIRARPTDTTRAHAQFAAKGASDRKYAEFNELAPKILLAGSACKQDEHRANGLKLADLVNRFAEIYWACTTLVVLTESKLTAVREPHQVERQY